MSIDGSVDPSPTPGEALNEAMIALTGCIGEAFADVCSVGLTIGDTYVPFRPDLDDECEDNEEFCSQVWVRLINMSPTGVAMSFGGGDCSSEMSVSIEVGILRCFDIPDDGEAPDATQMLTAAMQSNDDAMAIYCAAMNCEKVENLNAGSWEPMGPLGGQYGGTWTFTATL